ncbi:MULTISPECIES: acetoacetate decarboxylase family protein [Frankia]|uniref:Acetoacetate decarboxylase n=1 Tax=Frankia alni (strain DSM 45986 / CECT 9034 / ACN14a) TaxID=326424 RepID=Q0RJ64_FRAAA|nr:MULTISPECIES: acetoacetate decarboxylase family protein [Frankia]CAJ62449.1 hypothetical protein; putative PE-PGRS family protein [Frankia alni ACN14a]
MARRAQGGTWCVQDRLVSLPVTITDARAAVAVFRADPTAAHTVLAGTGLTPWTVAGRAVAVLLVVRYGPWVLGSYDEVGVGVAVRGPGRRRGLHLVDMPVTGVFTRDAGRAIWSLPKWLMTAETQLDDHITSIAIGTAPEPAAPQRPLPLIQRDETDTKASGHVVEPDGGRRRADDGADTPPGGTGESGIGRRDDRSDGNSGGDDDDGGSGGSGGPDGGGDDGGDGGGGGGGDGGVLRVRLEAGGVRVPFPVVVRIPLWCVLPDGPRAGVLLRGAMPVRLHGVRLGRGRTRVELGSHPMAERMAALGMTGRPLLTVTAFRLRGELGAFSAVAVRGGSGRKSGRRGWTGTGRAR